MARASSAKPVVPDYTLLTDSDTPGALFPYNIRRRAALPPKPLKRVDAVGTPIYSAYDGDLLAPGTVKTSTTQQVEAQSSTEGDAILDGAGEGSGSHSNGSVGTSEAGEEAATALQQTRNEVKSFSLRPAAAKTGRIIYRDPNLRKQGYGFDVEHVLEISTVTRSESAVIRRQLRTWIQEVKYRPAVGETRPFNTVFRARVLGFAIGSVGFYYGSQYFKMTQSMPAHFKLALVFVYGCFGSFSLKHWVTPAAYVELLQKNTPLGYKARQFLDEHRRQTAGLKTSNWLDLP